MNRYIGPAVLGLGLRNSCNACFYKEVVTVTLLASYGTSHVQKAFLNPLQPETSIAGFFKALEVTWHHPVHFGKKDEWLLHVLQNRCLSDEYSFCNYCEVLIVCGHFFRWRHWRCGF